MKKSIGKLIVKNKKVKIDTPEKFWKEYVNADILGRDKILSKVIKLGIWQEVLKMKGIKYKDREGLTLQEHCLKTSLMSYFNDLIDYMEMRK